MKETRGRIIAAARKLFEEKGFAAATTKQIAALAGLSEVTLFRHFETKRALFEETVHGCMHPYHIEHYLKEEVKYDLKEDLARIAYDIKETFLNNAPLLRIVMRDKIRRSEPEMAMRSKEHKAKEMLLAYFSAMHDAGRLDAEPQMALEFFVTNIMGYLTRIVFNGESPDEDYFSWMLHKVTCTLLKGESA